MFERTTRRTQILRSRRATPGLRARILRRWGPWHGAATLGVVFTFSAGLGLLWGAWDRICLGERCPSIAQITVWEPEQSSKLFAQDGSLISEFFQERRTAIDLGDLPPYVVSAFVAIEDKRFYGHGGLDYPRLFRAVAEYAIHGAGRPGGSTITQQLARNQFPVHVGFEVSPVRKAREAKVARDIERIYSKDEILQAYLNQINFGHGWYGIETAARNYFGKPASQINLPEAALLAALPKAPSRYSPLLDPEAALKRRNLVLDLMSRQGYLTSAEAEAAKAYPLPQSRRRGEDGRVAPYFVEWVRQMMDDRFGSDLYRGGFRIYTTLDLEILRKECQLVLEHIGSVRARQSRRLPQHLGAQARLGPAGELRGKVGRIQLGLNAGADDPTRAAEDEPHRRLIRRSRPASSCGASGSPPCCRHRSVHAPSRPSGPPSRRSCPFSHGESVKEVVDGPNQSRRNPSPPEAH